MMVSQWTASRNEHILNLLTSQTLLKLLVCYLRQGLVCLQSLCCQEGHPTHSDLSELGMKLH